MTSHAVDPRSVLVDAGAWLALADQDDAHHREATLIQQRLVTARSRLFVTNFLVDETYTPIRVRLSPRLAVRFLDRLYALSVDRIRITPDDEANAEAILRRFSDKRFSYTDATSFVVIERLGIEAAFTFDRNFTEYGRIRLLHP